MPSKQSSAKQSSDKVSSDKLLEDRITKLESALVDLQLKIQEFIDSNNTIKKNKKKSDSPKKPKPKTGYLIFSSENRQKIKDELTLKNGSNPIPADVIKELGAQWKALDQNTKDIYNTKAKQLPTS